MVGAGGAVTLFVSTLILSSGTANACTTTSIDQAVVATITDSIAGYRGDQLENAAAIMNAAIALGLTAQAQTVGVMTAMGESSLHNLDHGDIAGPDSRGLFQQRDTWGTLRQRMDPTAAAILFFARLAAVPSWETMPPSKAAHTVQGNDDPDHYTPFYAAAAAVVDGLSVRAGPGACAPRAANDDYPWPSQPTVKQGGSLSPLGYYYRECVDFVAYRLNRDAGITTAPWKYTWANLTPRGGDAINWRRNWDANGWTVSSTPVPGAVAWWGRSGGRLGHVAYVQSVAGGQVTVEEYNWSPKHGYGTRTMPIGMPDAYLYPPGR